MIQYNSTRSINLFILFGLFIIITKLDSMSLTTRKFSRIFDERSEIFRSCNQNDIKVTKTIETSSYTESNQVYEEFQCENKK